VIYLYNVIHHRSICRPLRFHYVPEVAGIEPRTVATLALIATRSARCENKSYFSGMIPETLDVSQFTNGECIRGETTRGTTGTRKGITTKHIYIVRQPAGIGSLESIIGLLKSLKIRAQTENRFLLCSAHRKWKL
jgi:hypothetical protein